MNRPWKVVIGLAGGLLIGANSLAAGEPDHALLANAHAPVVLQGIGLHPRQDIFTRLDFDGDFESDNNWENFPRHAVPPTVYYDVIESGTHWYITYAFFYPRDYAAACFFVICHENDVEGARVAVLKDGSENGKVVLLETLAHNVNRADTRPRMIEADGPRALISIEHGGHGIHSVNERAADRRHVTYSVVRRGRPVVAATRGYELRSLSEFWDQRENVGRRGTFGGRFDYRGTRFAIDDLPGGLKGRRWSDDRAMPPWAWHHLNRDLARGDWFLDPALSVCRWIRCDVRHSMDYLHHPYLGIESAQPRVDSKIRSALSGTNPWKSSPVPGSRWRRANS